MSACEKFEEILDNMFKGYTKVEITEEYLNKDVTEKCVESSSIGSCIAEINVDLTLYELMPLQQHVIMLVYLDVVSDYNPKEETLADCPIKIELVAESDRAVYKLESIHTYGCVEVL